MKSDQARNTGAGATFYHNEGIRADFVAEDPFLDNYSQELFACHAIMDKIHLTEAANIKIIINRKLLESVLHTYILKIRCLK